MIAELKFKNFFSFRDESVFSFEADNSKDMESYHVVEIAPGVRLLKIAVVYGANASGKSNFIKICDFIKNFITHIPLNKTESTGVVPFLLDLEIFKQPSELSLTFYVFGKERPIKYVYSLSLKTDHIINETLIYYSSQQPAKVFERTFKDGISLIKFGSKLKLSLSAQKEISLKCLSNMSVFAAYMQVNVNIPEIENVLTYFKNQILPAITPSVKLDKVANILLKEENSKNYILSYLQEADFNISDISVKEKKVALEEKITQEEKATQKIKKALEPEFITKEKVAPKVEIVPHTMFQHKVKTRKNSDLYLNFPDLWESKGTIRTMGLAAYIQTMLVNNALLAIDEIESSLHPKLLEYIIERFLKESDQAQLLLTTHYDGLLADDDLLRRDNIWFTEKDKDGASVLYPLTDFNDLSRISSLQKAYKYGKFGAIPNL